MSIFTKYLRYKPGKTCKVSGQYTDSDGHQITMVKGKTFPATQRPGMTWKLTDRTR